MKRLKHKRPSNTSKEILDIYSEVEKNQRRIKHPLLDNQINISIRSHKSVNCLFSSSLKSKREINPIKYFRKQ